MPYNASRDPYEEPSGDCRLRYSRRAVLSGMLAAGVLASFRNPVESLGQSEAGADERDARRGGSGRSEGREEPEKEREEGPRPPEDPTMQLYVPRLGIQGDTVMDGDSGEALARGAMKLPSTGYPWQDGSNPYIAGHRIGYPGRESHYQFYNLPAMRGGDPVFLKDANGTGYEYRVVEKFAVSPSESWVTEPVEGRDLVTLQTCVDSVAASTWWYITPKLMQAGPDTGRLIVRAERV